MAEVTVAVVPNDHPDLAAMWAEVFEDMIRTGHTDYTTVPPIDANLTCYMVSVDGNPAGINVYHAYPPRGHARIGYVREQFRRAGAWKAMIDFASADLKARGVKEVVLWVHADAAAMKAACEKRGDKLQQYRYLRTL